MNQIFGKPFSQTNLNVSDTVMKRHQNLIIIGEIMNSVQLKVILMASELLLVTNLKNLHAFLRMRISFG
jgi:hypothetical protein